MKSKRSHEKKKKSSSTKIKTGPGLPINSPFLIEDLLIQPGKSPCQLIKFKLFEG
jgi:hypothetical protein